MTRMLPRFPVVFRFAALACALAAVVAVTSGAGASPKDKLEHAKDELERIRGEIDSARSELHRIDLDLGAAAAAVDRAEGRLEQLTAQLLAKRKDIADARARYERISDRLNERAVTAFIQGPGSDIGFLLGATSLSELSDRLEFIDAVAQSDADLAQQVQNTRNELAADERELERLRADARVLAAEAEERKEEILAKFEQQQALLAEIAVDLEDAKKLRKKAAVEVREFLKEQRAQSYGGSHNPVPIPDGWEGILEVCPVGYPRSYGDGFGAPRYAGGYHLHKGVDILAPAGTAILAPFDGVAEASYNSLGGYVVFVSGKYGRVYNAHLSRYSEYSNGPVQAGDIIGYVGDTGDATGIPHDHFEFHPNVMPSSWPESAYGYAIIEDAINPYPLLTHACR